MSVVMIMEWPGVTKEQYEQTRKLVKWETDIPQGAMFHVATFDDKGLRVVDLWQSAEAFQSFVDKRLMPGVQQAGIQGEPKVEIYPAHALFTPGFRPV
jgi:hypothetical protein